MSVDGGHIKRVHAIGGGGQDTWSGTTLGFIQDSQNFLIEDNEFSFIDRAQAGDGSGMDFEGNTENVTFRNNVIHNNAGAALLILSTNGPNKNLIIEDNTFYNNARDPWNSEINSEIQGSNAAHTGIIRNNGIYRGDPSINFLSPNANWSGFTITGNRELEYSDVALRPTWWNFDTMGDFEGWGGFNDWANPAVSGGVLSGQSSGVDPYVYSAHTWVNSNQPTFAWIRMSQTVGTTAQVFFVTETDPVWEPSKSVFFNIIPDGNMHDYFVDLGSSINTKGVITQIRLNPTIEPGSEMAVDFVRLTTSTDPGQTPPSAPLPPPLRMVFTSIASEDGHILESAQNSGVGGTVSSTSTTFRLGDDSSNRAYRQFLSFDTSSLPDNASIVEATIGISRVGNPTGSIPIGVPNSVFGDILVDLATPSFGTNALTSSDWESSATKLAVSKFAWPAFNNGMTIFSRLENPDNDLINRAGKTQFRIRYENGTDGDGVADYMSYATSNNSNSSLRPTLTIKYYINDNPSADFDSDGDVDGRDFLIWQRGYGKAGTALRSDGDANSDTDVDSDDLTVWNNQYGTTPLLATLQSSEELSSSLEQPAPQLDTLTAAEAFGVAQFQLKSDSHDVGSLYTDVSSNQYWNFDLVAEAFSDSSQLDSLERNLNISIMDLKSLATTESEELDILDELFSQLDFSEDLRLNSNRFY